MAKHIRPMLGYTSAGIHMAFVVGVIGERNRHWILLADRFVGKIRPAQ